MAREGARAVINGRGDTSYVGLIVAKDRSKDGTAAILAQITAAAPPRLEVL